MISLAVSLRVSGIVGPDRDSGHNGPGDTGHNGQETETLTHTIVAVLPREQGAGGPAGGSQARDGEINRLEIGWNPYSWKRFRTVNLKSNMHDRGGRGKIR